MKKIKIGIIGVGSISEMHIKGYQKLPNVELYAFCDINEERVKEKGEKYGVTNLFTDVNEMVKLEGLDAVSVCVWNCSHYDCTMAALKAGLHVLCEKPLAMNAAQAAEMKEMADKMGKLLMVGFVMRFGDESRIAFDFIDGGYIGDIYYSKATYLRRHGSPGGWFADINRSGGGPVIDLGVHVIDHTRYLMGKPNPVSVYASTYNHLKDRPDCKNDVGWKAADAKPDDVYGVEDMGVALIKYDNGATTLLETSYSLNGTESTKKEIYGTKGGMSLAGEPVIYTEVNGYLADITPKTTNLKNSGGNMFDEEMAHFVDCIVNGTECIAPAEDGITVMKILDAIYESAKTGCEVKIK